MRNLRALEVARDPVALALAALTLGGLLLRLPAVGQGLDGDEFFTYTQTVDRSLGDVLEADQENNPPLFYVLAWAGAKLGDPTVSIRLPSLLLGTASIPVVYALGVRTVGRTAGLVGAAVIALSPFSAFYGIEARSYATLVFLSALSTLSLVSALDTGRRRWWALYALSSAGVLYTHYLGAFVLLAQAAWSLWAHRRRLRPLLLANGAVALLALPLLPSVIGERGALLPEGPLTARLLITETLRLFYGHPQVPWDELPGRFAGLVLAATAVAAVAVAVVIALGARPQAARPSPPVVLLALLAVATPVGFLLYSLAGPSIVLGRYLLPSLPAFALLAGALVTSLPRPLSIGVTTVLGGVLAFGAVKGLGSDYQRPDYKSAARLVESEARPGDVVVDADSGLVLGQAFLGGGLARSGQTYLAINLSGKSGLRRVSSLSAAVSTTARRDHVFLVGRAALPEPPAGLPLRPLETKTFPGIRTVAVRIYVRERDLSAAAQPRRTTAITGCLRRQGLSPTRADTTAGAVVLNVRLPSGARGLVLLFASPSLAQRSVEGVEGLVSKGGGEAERRGSAVIGYFQTPTASDARRVGHCLPA